jgi:hypothetical protein
MTLAQKKVEDAGRSPDVVRAARQSAETVLRSSFAALGWTVSVRWEERKGPSAP